jgi:hypothetical protein
MMLKARALPTRLTLSPKNTDPNMILVLMMTAEVRKEHRRTKTPQEAKGDGEGKSLRTHRAVNLRVHRKQNE